jgi:hypothetical protein
VDAVYVPTVLPKYEQLLPFSSHKKNVSGGTPPVIPDIVNI